MFLPVSRVQARFQSTTLEWLANEPDYKEAKIHVLTHNASYTLLLSANITEAGSETYIYITAMFNPEGFASSISVAIPDTLFDAPYASGVPVSAFHIDFPPLFAQGLAVIMVIVLIFGIFYFFEAILTQIATDLIGFLGKNFFFWASIPWVYLSIYGRDKNDDGSLSLYVPYDSINLSFIAYDYMYIATSKSWWTIEKRVWSWLIFSVTYYTAVWKQDRIALPPILVPPWAWFEWSPTTPVVGQQVAFVSTSFDPDGDIMTSHWTFGDGFEAYDTNTTHAYTSAGWHTVTLEVTDNDGLTSSTSALIQFNPSPRPVGGFEISPDNVKTYAPLIVLGSVISLVAVALVRRKKKNE
jgi:hypothetical protein